MRFRSVKNVAAMLDVSQRTVRHWIDKGIVPAKRIGGRVLVDLDALEQKLQDEGEPVKRKRGRPKKAAST